jgi:peptidoglycan hydrolase CwlO-like protein
MIEHVYPVPADSHRVEELLRPFLNETVAEDGLSPNNQFMIVLFGDDASEHRDNVIDVVENAGPVARKSLDINQLCIVSIDERRLNTFTTSLLYALLETDPNQPLQDTLSADYIADEDERKIDYYLPRVVERVENALFEEGKRFDENLQSLFPVDLEAQDPRDMNKRLDKDVVTENVIIDFMLLAAASTEDKRGVERLLRHIREEKIDDSEMLSGGSSSVSGYSRIIGISYLISTDQFNSEFRTARELYDTGTTSRLLGLLNETEEITAGTDVGAEKAESDGGSETPLESFYSIEQRVERLITSQFQGNGTTIAQRLLRTINGTRLIQNNQDAVLSSYQSQKADLESEITNLRGELTSLEAQGDEFDETKIVVDTGEPDPYEKIVTLVDDTNSLITRFVFGFDRTSRTSVFTTLETRLREYRENLSYHRTQIDDLLNKIDNLDSRCEREVRKLEATYDRLEATSVEVDAPDRAQMVENLRNAWQEELAQLRHDLPVIDFTDEDEDPGNKLNKWDTEIRACRKQLDELRAPVDQLDQTVEKVEQIDKKRSEVRKTLSSIDDLMVEQ